MSYEFHGKHVLAELTGIDAGILSNEGLLRAAVEAAVTEAGATLLQIISHRFAPQGVSVVALLAESHASLHTWPERGSAFADIFTCGDKAKPERAVVQLAENLGANVTVQMVCRGAITSVQEPVSVGVTRVWDVEEVIWEGRTAYQHVLIARTAQGVALFCDDERQSTDTSQLVYHEALIVPALTLAEQTRKVLVIGSSEGVACQLAVAAGAHLVDHVDIDAECVRLCAAHLPYGYTLNELHSAEQGNGPVRMHYADGWAFLERAQERYDVIVIDLPDERPDDPGAQHNRLYSGEFLRRASEVLAPGGVVVGQAGCATLWRNDTLRRSVERYNNIFSTVVHYGSDEHEWSFLTGAPREIDEPTELMGRNLKALSYRPQTLDVAALRRGAVLPHALRRRGEQGQ